MPRFTPDGLHIVMGTSALSVDGHAVAKTLTAGNPQPDSPKTFIAQALFEGAWQLLKFNLAGDVLSVASGMGQNDLAAGAGVWAAWLDGPGYRDAYGHLEPLWGVLAVDDLTGKVAVCEDRQNGNGLLVVDAKPFPHSVEDGPLGSGEACFRSGVLSYRNAAGQLATWDVSGAPPVARDVPVSGVRFSGDWRLSYLNGTGLVIHRWADEFGIVVSGREDDFNSDIYDHGGGLVSVVSSATTGEAPGDLRRYAIDAVMMTVDGKPARAVKLTTTVDPPQGEPMRGLFIESAVLPDGVTIITNKWLYVQRTPDGAPEQDESYPIRYSSAWTPESEVKLVLVGQNPQGDNVYDVQWPLAARRLSSGPDSHLQTRALNGAPGMWEQFPVIKYLEQPTRGLVYRTETVHLDADPDPTPTRIRSVAITLRPKP